MHESEGFRVVGSDLVIGFIKGQGTTVRFAEVKIPLRDLLQSERFKDAAEREVRRILVEKWSGLPIDDDPLF